ncbi:YfiR family protein [Flammeovirgaceae bacterium SG7u.111]|nr:YfiR family protein [Flammeovirgaceae bacterium SG7u.132]WPO33471.1 YfiR family protein [Flammeovirgaceae bacterium SG7u.111]
MVGNFKTFLALSVLLPLFWAMGFEVKAQEGTVANKAEWLISFSKFIDWPSKDQEETFSIKILGDENFYQYLNYIYADRTVKGKPVKVSLVFSSEEVSDCHILFVSSEFKESLPEIIQKTKSHPILTVGEYTGFAKDGIMINFFTENGEIRFELNPDAANKSGLSIGYQLFQVAKVVKFQP